MKNGEYATEEDMERLKKEYKDYFQNANLYRGIITFPKDYLDNSIEYSVLEQKLMKEIIPKFLKHCGFKDIDKMDYVAGFHTNTDHPHFHISFIEKEPNFIGSDNKIKYRRKGTFSKEEMNFMKNEVLHTIDRHREFTPLVIKSNKEIDDLKKYFNPKDRNYILRDKEDLILEENILKLGKMLDEKRNGKQGKIKFNSIYDKEIKTLTKNIKKYLFKNKNSELYKKDKEFKESLNQINDYFLKLNKANNIKHFKYKSEYSLKKEEYVDNYIYNAIVNSAYYQYSKLKNKKAVVDGNEIIQEAILKQYKKNKKNSKYNILVNYLTNTTKESRFKNKHKIEQSIKKINEEMEEAFYVPKKMSSATAYSFNQLQIHVNNYITPEKINYYNEYQNCQLKKANSYPTNSPLINTNSPTYSPTYYGNSPYVQAQTVTPFSLKEPAFSMNDNTCRQRNAYYGISNVHIGNSFSASSDNEKDLEKKENTDILIINVKVSKTENLVFKIRRYDDMFKTVQMFCEINQLDSQFIKPMIINVIKALNAIYTIYNTKLTAKDVQYLNKIKIH